MPPRTTIDKLSSRIDRLVQRFAPPEPPPECWIVEGDKAWPRDGSKDDAIPFAELQARPPRPPGKIFRYTRLLVRLVHADCGKPAVCCLPGGECYRLHGPCGEPS
jgi:hypothetical protein